MQSGAYAVVHACANQTRYRVRHRVRHVAGPATKGAAGKSLSRTTPYLKQQAEAEKGLLAAQQAMVGAWLSKTKAADAAAERSAAAAQKASIAYALSTAQVKQKLAAAHKAVLDAEDAATVADSATSTLQARLLADPPASGDGASPPPTDAMASSGDAVLDVMARLRESQEATAAAHELRVKNLRLQQAAEDAVRAARDAAVLRANTRATALHTVDRAVALASQRLREAAALSQKTARDLSTQLRVADKGASDAARAEELRRPPEEVASALHSSLAQANAARALHDLASAEAQHAMFARRVYESFVSAADKLHAALEGRPAGSGSLSSKGRDASPEARLRWDALAGACGRITLAWALPLPPTLFVRLQAPGASWPDCGTSCRRRKMWRRRLRMAPMRRLATPLPLHLPRAQLQLHLQSRVRRLLPLQQPRAGVQALLPRGVLRRALAALPRHPRRQPLRPRRWIRRKWPRPPLVLLQSWLLAATVERSSPSSWAALRGLRPPRSSDLRTSALSWAAQLTATRSLCLSWSRVPGLQRHPLPLVRLGLPLPPPPVALELLAAVVVAHPQLRRRS